MNSSCLGYRVRDLKNLPAYQNLPRGTRHPISNRTKSRCTKSMLCELLHIHGSGKRCNLTKNAMRQLPEFLALPVNHDARRRNALKQTICDAISRPKVMTLRLTTAADPEGALTATSMGTSMINNCGPDNSINFDLLPEGIFASSNELIQLIRAAKDNTISALVIVTHGSAQTIQTGVYQDMQNISPVFAQELNKKLMVGAKILLMACRTGYVAGGPASEGTTIYTDADHIPCFANRLAAAVPGHQVYAVHNDDHGGAWALGPRAGPCDKSSASPLPYSFFVDNNRLNVFQFTP